ncbi:hypothetical protein ACOMHN_046773 [Nucella lapillus]
MSSIIPARGRHHLNNSVFPSNRNLHAACKHQNVTYIDNTDIFTTSSGAPRLALYLNLTHPSDRGTARLATNIRSIWQRNERESFRRDELENVHQRANIHSRDYGDGRRQHQQDLLQFRSTCALVSWRPQCRVLLHFHTLAELVSNLSGLWIHGELSLEGRGEGHNPRVGASLSLAPRLSNYCCQ